MSGHTRRGPIGRLVATVMALAALSGCAPPQAELFLVLTPATGADLSEVNALRINVRELSELTPEVFEAIDLNETTEERLRADVPPESPFYVDIWGCPDVDNCRGPDVIARGCTRVLQLEVGEERSLGVAIGNIPVDGCPPTS